MLCRKEKNEIFFKNKMQVVRQKNENAFSQKLQFLSLLVEVGAHLIYANI